jgi:hypothetical protein
VKQAINMHHTGKAKVCVFIKPETARRMKVLAVKRSLPGVSELVEQMVAREDRLEALQARIATQGGTT